MPSRPKAVRELEARAKETLARQLLAAGFRVTTVKHAHEVHGRVLVTLEICVTAETLNPPPPVTLRLPNDPCASCGRPRGKHAGVRHQFQEV